MPRLPEDLSPHAGAGYGAPGTSRPSIQAQKDPERWMRMVRLAARARIEGRSWADACRESGIPFQTLKSWTRFPERKTSRIWKAVLEEEAKLHKVTPEGTPLPPEEKAPEVKVEGFQSPEALADHWSLWATKVHIETMLDPRAARRERNEAAKRIQDLGGHSPVSRSVVITAPIEDRKVAAALFSVLQEVKRLREAPPKQIGQVIEGESEPA